MIRSVGVLLRNGQPSGSVSSAKDSAFVIPEKTRRAISPAHFVLSQSRRPRENSQWRSTGGQGGTRRRSSSGEEAERPSDLNHLIAPKYDHVSSRRCGVGCPCLKLRHVWLMAPSSGKIGIGENCDLPALPIDHHLRSCRLPLITKRFISQPKADELPAHLRAS